MLNDKSGILLLDECNTLKIYNYDLVNDIEEQIKFCDKHIDELKKNTVITEEVGLNFAFLKFYKERCQNILGVYTLKRFQNTNELNTDMLSDEESIFWKFYIKAINDYFDNFSYIKFSWDEDPPLHIFVHVLCTKEGGIIYDGEDCIDIQENRIYFVRRKSINRLLIDGSVQIINN